MKFFVSALVLFFLSACSSMTQMAYRSHELAIQMGSTRILLPAMQVDKRVDTYGSVAIYQYILQLNEGNFVVYEDVRTDLEYEFEPTMMRTIDVLFQAHKKVLLFAKDHMRAYQLVLSDNAVLNLLIQQSDSQQLQLLYGMSAEQMVRILKGLGMRTPKLPYANVMTFHRKERAIQTHWNVQNVHFYPLVVPLPRFWGL